jgi:hypothetical protein
MAGCTAARAKGFQQKGGSGFTGLRDDQDGLNLDGLDERMNKIR